ncbi:OmpA family protein [Flavobacterium amniphilum]|uniref:OmpA family protein n=1 Tax=Flavobacterium amniphilum TaxID=1834035 RepID=UPI002029F0C5|nr:OmpA family protein [Flavobacterium amniphilum]MCL9806607.1 OmpA family protein [Flavobacterium amniphilum]
MSKRTIYILGIITTLILGSYTYSKYCCIDCHLQKNDFQPLKFKSTEDFAPKTVFQITGDDFDYSSKNNFDFKKEEFYAIEPIDKSIFSGIDHVKLFFDKNQNKRLIIMGFSLKNEKNRSIYPNLGYARANIIKNYFIQHGIASNRIEIIGKTVSKWHTKQNKICGPVLFQITNNQFSARAQDWEGKKEEYNDNPLYLYFNPNQPEITLTEDERQRLADLTIYLDNIPDSILECIGNSDDTNDSYVNIQLGQERADFVKECFVKNGIPENRIVTTSRGSKDPISDNITPEGKAKNQRTTIILK